MLLNLVLSVSANISLSIMYWAIWLFTKAQFASNQTCRWLYAFYKTHIIVNPHFISIAEFANIPLTKTITNNVEYVKNGKVVYTTTLSDLINDTSIRVYDFIIVSKYENQESSCINKQIFYDAQELKNGEKKTESSMKFISTTILDIPVEFKTNQYNYYMDGNTWSPKFLEYFMKTHYKIPDTETSEKIIKSLCIIDNNANIINSFTYENHIRILKKSYSIVVT
jgi:hypothetical protein